MLTDPVSDMLTTIRNGQMAKLAKVSTPASNLRKNILEVIKKEGFIRDYKEVEVRKNIKRIEIQLKYFEGKGAITEVWRESKPGLRKYAAADNLPKFRNGLGMAIISTSKGMMTDADARRQNIGGEVICGIF